MWVLIAPVPGHCVHITFNLRLICIRKYFNKVLTFDSAVKIVWNGIKRNTKRVNTN